MNNNVGKMETTLCRICGKLGQNDVNIFQIEGLTNKIETCLPVIVTPHTLLPDTVCIDCIEKVNGFYSFIKSCLQNIIILESQYNIQESCLKTKRKKDKSTITERNFKDQSQQTDEFLDLFLTENPRFSDDFYLTETNPIKLVDYEIVSESETESIGEKKPPITAKSNKYFDDDETGLINEILQRRRQGVKRKSTEEIIEKTCTKIFKTNHTNRRKNFQPKKIQLQQICLLCGEEFDGPTALSNHFYEIHQIDSTEIFINDNRKKKLPNLLKISDLKKSDPNPTTTGCPIYDGWGNQIEDNQPIDGAYSQGESPENYSNNRELVEEPLDGANGYKELQFDYQEPRVNCFNNPRAEYQPRIEDESIYYENVESSVNPETYFNETEVNRTRQLTENRFSALTIPVIESRSASSLPVNETQYNNASTEKRCYNTSSLQLEENRSNNATIEGRYTQIQTENRGNIRQTTNTRNKQSRQSQTITEGPPTLLPSFVCHLCPAVFTIRHDLFNHLRIKHSEQASLLCGICLNQTTSLTQLKSHLDVCLQQHTITTKYYCDTCYYGDDNARSLENHVPVHKFLLGLCTKDVKNFDPADFIKLNPNVDLLQQSRNASYNCDDCDINSFDSFKEFSTHRRNQHSIFHCDLCNKFYGRNSHLWKHVNRLHKGHPSVTCQMCFKTSASKYHLAQHFTKIHTTKSTKQSKMFDDPTDFMSQKFQAYNFQSVKQSFMRQEMLEQSKKLLAAELKRNNVVVPQKTNKDDLTTNRLETGSSNSVGSNSTTTEIKTTNVKPPKEIDSTSDLYTNIITNYTPPANEGEFKCPKCGKGFHKKNLLKKHKKNCRPRSQEDLLTRCKSCSRVFKDRQSLKKHLTNYHSEYVCEICKEMVQSKCEIVSHIRFSHPGCHLFCNLCSNILRSEDDLEEHCKDHANSYICQFCGDSLPSKIKLKMHILSLHRKILSLSCGLCLKLFETQYILRDHVRLVHAEQLNPLTSCTVCGKNYGSKWKTYDHLNKSHGRIFNACKFCLEVFDNENDLTKHYQTIHNHVVANNQKNPTINQVAHVGEIGESDLDSRGSSESNKDSITTNRNNPTIIPSKNSAHSNLGSTKISLLEKRLIGTKKILNNHNTINNNNKKKVENLEKIIVDNKPKQDSKSQIVTTNSSKRTVYVNSNDPSCCEICYKTWPAKKHLWQHYIRCHKQVAATVCGICLKTNDDYESLQKHLYDNHPTLLFGQGFGSNFICRICGRYHNASSKLKLHMAIHENFDLDSLDKKVERTVTTLATSSLVESTTGLESNKELLPNEGTTQIDEVLALPNTSNDKSDSNQRITNGINDNNDDINYESLIEQVECSSENDESDSKSNSSSDDDDDDDSDADIDGDDDDSNSLENQMLQNMLKEKQMIINNNESQSSVVKYDNNDDDASDDSITNFSDIILKSDEDDDLDNDYSELAVYDDEDDDSNDKPESKDESNNSDDTDNKSESRERRSESEDTHSDSRDNNTEGLDNNSQDLNNPSAVNHRHILSNNTISMGSTNIERMPIKIEGMPTQIEAIPTQNQTTQIQAIHTQIGGIPTKIEGIPTLIENMPTQFGGISAQIEGIPTQIDGIPIKTEEIPIKIEGIQNHPTNNQGVRNYSIRTDPSAIDCIVEDKASENGDLETRLDNNEISSSDDDDDTSQVSLNSSSRHKSNSTSTNGDDDVDLLLNNTSYKSEELDSAIQSIKFDGSDDYYEDDDDCDDIVYHHDINMYTHEEKQTTITNDNEIESAVGSIL